MIDYYALIPEEEQELIICEVVSPKKNTPGLIMRVETDRLPFIVNQFYATVKDGRLQIILHQCGVNNIPHTEIIPDDYEFYKKKLTGKTFKAKLIKSALKGQATYIMILPKPPEAVPDLKAAEGVENLEPKEASERVTVAEPVANIIEGLSEEDLEVLKEDGII